MIAVDTPTPKRRRLTDYFAKLPSNTEAQEFPQCLMSTLVLDDKRFSDMQLSHYPVDVVAPYSCLNKKRRHLACSRACYSATSRVMYPIIRHFGFPVVIFDFISNYFSEAQINKNFLPNF